VGSERSGRRVIPPSDIALFWEARAAGRSIKESASIAGLHINTGTKMVARQRKLAAELELADAEVTRLDRAEGGVNKRVRNKLAESSKLPPVIPTDRLCAEAREALYDFAYFRLRYFGRVSVPWQVDAALRIEAKIHTPEKEYIVVNVAPGMGKSAMMHDFAAWLICRDRDERIMFFSATERLAKQYSRQLRDSLESPVPIKATEKEKAAGIAVDAVGCLALDYGRFKPSKTGSLWTAGEFSVAGGSMGASGKKEPTVCAYGIDSKYIGHRARILLADDVANSKNSVESVARDGLIRTWDTTTEERLEPGGVLALVMQRLGPLDLAAHCLAKKTYADIDDEESDDELVETPQYEHIVYQAYYEELDTGPASRRKDAPPWPDGPLLNPRRVGWADIRKKRAANPDMFATVYQQQDIAEGTYLIEEIWAKGGMGRDGVIYPGCIDRDRHIGYIPRGLEGDIVSVAMVDPSGTEKWAYIWLLYQPSTNLYHVVDIARGKMTAEGMLGYNTTTRQYSGIMEDWQPRSKQLGYPISHWIVEENAAQRYLLAYDHIRKWCALHHTNILGHTTGRNKLDPNLGIEALIPPLFRSGAIRLPSTTGTWQSLALMKECSSWTHGKKKGTDLVMALWMGLLHIPDLIRRPAPKPQRRPTWILDPRLGQPPR